MPKSYTSPFGSSFNSAIKRGTPCSTAVENIAKRNNKTTTSVWNSLWKAGLVNRQKFNGQWIYWATNGTKGNATNWKTCQTDMWQCFVDWCICNGCCTPEQFSNNKGSQAEFMSFCRKFFAKQFSNNTASKTKKSSTKKSTGRKTTTNKKRTTTSNKKSTRNYSFPKSSTRKYRRAA